MKTILLGNAGAGKSTLTAERLRHEKAAVLSLDQIAFEDRTATRRPLEASIVAVREFISAHDSWIVEGCYADIVEAVLNECEELIFLNPGIDVCVDHCRRRPWEPGKFDSPEAQEQNLDHLIRWVQSYETRQDEYGLARHRELFEAFVGDKREFLDPSDYV